MCLINNDNLIIFQSNYISSKYIVSFFSSISLFHNTFSNAFLTSAFSSSGLFFVLLRFLLSVFSALSFSTDFINPSVDLTFVISSFFFAELSLAYLLHDLGFEGSPETRHIYICHIYITYVSAKMLI